MKSNPTHIISRCVHHWVKAIRLNQFQTVALLLNKGASIEKVCISKFNEQQSALEVAKKYKNKRVLKLIESYLNKP